MTRKPRRIAPEVQTLEGRALLSVLGQAPPKGAVELAAQRVLTKLSANLKGRFALGAEQITLTLRRGSTVQRVGAVKGSGVLNLGEGAVTGGTLTFGNKKGQITLDLVGSVPLPAAVQSKVTLNLVIAGGTGVFGSLSGPAVANLTIKATAPTAGTFGGTVKRA
jgi:hypothetical protein